MSSTVSPSLERFVHALALDERQPRVSVEGSLPAEAWREARARADAWRGATRLPDAAFEARLAAARLDRESWLRVLVEQEAGSPPTPREGVDLEWLEVLDEIRRGTSRAIVVPSVTWTQPDGSKTTEPPFGSFIRPFLQVGVRRLRAATAPLEADPPLLEPAAETALVMELVQRLVKECSSTLILELNVARLEGRLEGETPAERFRFFSERSFTAASVLALLEEYPTLARSMAVVVRSWAAAMGEMVARLAADCEALGPLGTVLQITLGISDPHRGGRSVAILEDASGRRVVYKPTPLEVDRRMGDLIEGVNRLGLRHRLEHVTALDRGDYGWQHHVEVVGCAVPEEVARFYWRQGALLALLHVTRGADIHHENLIARGEHPILVDHEALFQHGRSSARASPETASPETASSETASTSLEEASDRLGASVLRQALLPFVFHLTREGDGLDSSGLGGASGQVAQGSVRRWADPATDRMRVVPADLVSQEAQNRPTLDGAPVDAGAYLEQILDGFGETYDLLAAHRDEIRPLLDAFAETPVRHLVRPTRIYTVFLRESRHPDDLRDALSRDELLDRLWVLAATQSPDLLPVVPHEHRDLRERDVPAFSTRPGALDLWSSRGERIEGVFERSSLAEAHAVLDGLSAEDRAHQELLIRLALSEARGRAESSEPPPGVGATRPARSSGRRLDPSDPKPEASSPEGALLDGARRLGELLARRALPVDGGVHWITMDPFVGDTPEGVRGRNVTLAGADLYHGGAGIALFLAHLGALTEDEAMAELARGTVETMLESMRGTTSDGSPSPPVLGAFTGRGAFAYVLTHLAALWDEPALLERALDDLPIVETLIDDDLDLDLLAGAAGYISVALHLHRATGDGRVLAIARRCGEHLLARSAVLEIDSSVSSRATGLATGRTWTGRSFDEPVAGLSHGMAGITWPLFELAAATGDARFAQAAAEGILAEREILRTSAATFHARVSWCHGLPSVALGRMLAKPLLAPGSAVRSLLDPALAAAVCDPLEDEIHRGVARILDAGPPVDACLCHGVLGNAQILELAADAARDPHDAGRRTARSWALEAARGIDALDGGAPLPLHARFAGLFCGLSGLGWGLLRFAAPDRVPSVLSLAPPVRSPAGR